MNMEISLNWKTRTYPKLAKAPDAKSVNCATAAPQAMSTGPSPNTRLKSASAALNVMAKQMGMDVTITNNRVPKPGKKSKVIPSRISYHDN